MKRFRAWRTTFVMAFILLSVGAPSHAQSGNFSGNVIDIAVEYMPDAVVFRLSNPPSGCPLVAGLVWLRYAPGSMDAAKAAYATVLSALLAGTTRSIFLNVNGTAPNGMCNVVWLHIS